MVEYTKREQEYKKYNDFADIKLTWQYGDGVKEANKWLDENIPSLNSKKKRICWKTAELDDDENSRLVDKINVLTNTVSNRCFGLEGDSPNILSETYISLELAKYVSEFNNDELENHLNSLFRCIKLYDARVISDEINRAVWCLDDILESLEDINPKLYAIVSENHCVKLNQVRNFLDKIMEKK